MDRLEELAKERGDEYVLKFLVNVRRRIDQGTPLTDPMKKLLLKMKPLSRASSEQ